MPMMTYGDKSPSEKAMKLKRNLEMAYENRMKNSSKSRKRVESLKKRNCPKNSTCTTRAFEKPAKNDWVTSGSLGSRDAVLVFRTNILNPETVAKQNVIVENIDVSSLQGIEFEETTRISSPASSLPSHSTKAATTKKSTQRTVVDRCKVKDERNISRSTPTTPTRSSTSCGSYGLEMMVNPTTTRRIKAGENHNTDGQKGTDTDDGNGDVTLSMAQRFKPIQLIDTKDRSKSVLDLNENYNPREGEERTSSETLITKDNNSLEEIDEYLPVPGMPAIELQITYKFQQTETLLLRRIFHRHGLTEAGEHQNFNILWSGVHMKPDILRGLTPYQRVNHFPRSYELTRKDRLYKNIERMQHLRGFKHFDIVPQSFVLPIEYKDLVTAHNKTRGPWIVKPAASSRGRGIFIVTSPDQIPPDEPVLVSKYITDPLCIDGHKCDLRVYVLVTSFDPLIIYMYEEGLVRLATVKYNLNADNLWNPCMHLCNYSINKYHMDYVKSNDAQDENVGHKWTLSALLRHLKSRKCDTRLLMSNIEDLIIKSFLCCAQSIIAACRMFVPNGNNCFELYGFDILIDNQLKPWLLEVNLSPSIGIDSPLDAKVKASMLTDLLTCVGIPALTPAMRKNYDSKWTRFRTLAQSKRTNSSERSNWKRRNNSSGSSNNSSCNNSIYNMSGVGGVSTTNARPLTVDEQRILRNARFQDARRGGFVRIFPTENTMSRYGSYLDPISGIPISTTIMQGQTFQTMAVPHNHNQMLFNRLFANELETNAGLHRKEDSGLDARMEQYERALENCQMMAVNKKRIETKSAEEGKRLRRQVLHLIGKGIELTQLQSRQAFSLYLDCVLQRLSRDTRECHERIILKFLNRFSGGVRAPVFFRNAHNIRTVVNKPAHTAMVVKLLYDFLDQYNRDSEAYVDGCDEYGMIPSHLFMEFLSQAQESDLEAVLTMHTNLNGTMPYLYNRFGVSIPATPPIPSGSYGFLKALPAMVQSPGGLRDYSKCDTQHYNRTPERSTNELPKGSGGSSARSKGKHRR